MKSAIVVFPASNCDRDFLTALEKITGNRPHMVWHRDAELPKVDLIAVPGGFSFGDYLRAGAMAARSPIMAEVKKRAEQGVAVVGVCNGFQILTEAGLLPGALMRNADLKFVCKDVHLRVERTDTPYTNKFTRGQVVRMPIAHHDGNYFADSDTLKKLEDEGQVVFRYCDESGALNADANPNGSRNNIAGLVNERGNVIGMMPHPERMIEPVLGGTDGRIFFESVISALA